MEWHEHIAKRFRIISKEKSRHVAHKLTCWLSEHRGETVHEGNLNEATELTPYLEPLEGKLIGSSLLPIPWSVHDQVHFNIVTANQEIPALRWLLSLPGFPTDEEIRPKIDLGIYIDHCAEMIMTAKQSVMISNPYWSESAIIRLTNRMHSWVPPKSLEVSIITRNGLDDYEASALGKLRCFLRMKGAHVLELEPRYSISGIHHAKFFIADRSKIILGSANLTHKGTAENVELSIYVESKDLVDPMVKAFERFFMRID